MSQLVQVGKDTYYIDLPSKVGVYRVAPGSAILIDSSSYESARKIEAVLEENGLRPQAIVNTHSHADHIGCNAYLQEKYNCPIYANGIEVEFIREPLLAACYLYGAYPYKLMRHSFLMGKASQCQYLDPGNLPAGFEVAPLYGHAMGMIALKTPDNIWFTGDIACAPSILEKYPLAFVHNTTRYLASLDEARELKGELFICSHADPTASLDELLDFNKETMERMIDYTWEACQDGPQSFETILARVCALCKLNLNFMLRANMGSTVKAHISHLVDSRRLKPLMEENILKYQALSPGEAR